MVKHGPGAFPRVLVATISVRIIGMGSESTSPETLGFSNRHDRLGCRRCIVLVTDPMSHVARSFGWITSSQSGSQPLASLHLVG